MTDNKIEIDVAIIGAGVSGLYCGYRLIKSKDKILGKNPNELKINIFEMSNRLGGRLESVQLENMNYKSELGGMRFLPDSHLITNNLIEELNKNSDTEKLTIIDFPMGDENSNLISYLRGQRIYKDTWKKSLDLIKYNFERESDRGLTSDELFNKIIYDVIISDQEIKNKYNSKIYKLSNSTYVFKLSRADWEDIKQTIVYNFPESPLHGLKLSKIGFWNLIKDQVGQEGYNFLSDAGGYYSNTINWNSAEAFEYMIGDFTSNSTYKTLQQGFDSIPLTMAEEIDRINPDIIKTKHHLISINKIDNSDYKYQLIFDNGAKYYCKHLILAMPKRSLELLGQKNIILQNVKFQELRDSVIKQPAFKVLLKFDIAWWTLLGINSGHSITDLPLRQCYYFEENDQGEAILLASYGDMRALSFWKPLSDEPTLIPDVSFLATKPEIIPLALDNENNTPEKPANDFYTFLPDHPFVKELINQLSEMHGVNIPPPSSVYFKDWTEDPFGAGFHAWKASVDVNDVKKKIRKPFEDEYIYICGEAYSTQQGWIEGAFEEAKLMLEEHFNMTFKT